MKYLGLYETEYLNESETVLVPMGEEPLDTDTHCNYYHLDEMMAHTRTKEFPFDGTLCLSNTGGIAIQMLDTCDVCKVWSV